MTTVQDNTLAAEPAPPAPKNGTTKLPRVTEVKGELLETLPASEDLATYERLRTALIAKRDWHMKEAQEIALKLGLEAKAPVKRKRAPKPEVPGAIRAPVAAKETSSTTAKLEAISISTRVLQRLQLEGGYHNVAAIALATGLENRQVSLALSDLKVAGKVKSKGKARGTTWAAK